MDATTYRDTVAKSSSSVETADTADTEGSVGIVENTRNQAGRPKKLPKQIHNQTAIHRFLNSNEPVTDKETDSEYPGDIDDPCEQ